MSDFVERLRTFDTHSNDARAVCDEAADEIARLTAEVERLQSVVDAALAYLRQPTFAMRNALAAAISALEGEPCPTKGDK
jgi:hypothetical protein